MLNFSLQADIEKMVREAEEHANEDKKRRDLIEAKNSADSAIYGYVIIKAAYWLC